MPDWLVRALTRIHEAARAGRVRLTGKALRELAELDPVVDEADVIEALLSLTASDLEARLRSTGTGEWLYVFTPTLDGRSLYLKVALRAGCIVISFHAQQEVDDDDA